MRVRREPAARVIPSCVQHKCMNESLKACHARIRALMRMACMHGLYLMRLAQASTAPHLRSALCLVS